ncbi:MAG: phosphoribosyltransferase family protein [Thermomicrobiales bacterium]
MSTSSSGAAATLARPLDQGILPGEKFAALEEIDFTREAAVAFEIAVDQRGAYVEARTGASLQPVVEAFSRMKYGDLDAVTFFAGHLAATALRHEFFLAFCRRAAASEHFTYIVSTAMFNVPSASNLLARTTADYLNIGLATMGLPPVINAQQTRLTESLLGYARRTVRERASAPVDGAGSVVTIVPESFRSQSVIFLDDLFNSGYSANRTRPRLRRVHVAEIFSLFAVRVDPPTVAATDGMIEFQLNNAVIDGSLESVAPMLRRGSFAVVQKLLKITLDPSITAQLPAFLADLPTAAILKIYCAAASNDYRRRYQGQFAPSLQVYESVLRERGVLDASGHIEAASIAQAVRH